MRKKALCFGIKFTHYSICCYVPELKLDKLLFVFNVRVSVL